MSFDPQFPYGKIDLTTKKGSIKIPNFFSGDITIYDHPDAGQRQGCPDYIIVSNFDDCQMGLIWNKQDRDGNAMLSITFDNIAQVVYGAAFQVMPGVYKISINRLNKEKAA